MADWQQKRFWTQVEIAQQELGYTVLLDGRLVKTPAKTLLALPTKPLAEAVAAEWRAQVETVRPETMPYTRRANAALDKVTRQFQDVLNMLAAYGETDLLCYRAAQPAESVLLYPNPAKSELQLKYAYPTHAQYTIYSLTGQVMATAQHSHFVHSINVSHLSSGTYLLQAKSDKGEKYYRFIKE